MKIEIIEKIAFGSFGTVFKVKRQNETFAFKELHTNSKDELRRVKRGFETAKKIIHPNCVKMIEWVEEEKTTGFLMEFVDGNPINKIFGTKKNLNLVLKIIIQVCNGLEILHSQKIIHRDLKPSNILVTKDHLVKITDFDFAKSDTLISLTKTGNFIGTVKYSSPEQCVESKHLDERSDLYSLGVIFYELVTGKVPFDGTSFSEIASKHLKTPLIPPTSFTANLPIEIEKIIKKLLQKSPNERFQNVKEVISELKLFLNKNKTVEIESLGEFLLNPIFVGREKALMKLRENYSRLFENQGRMVFISGESGIGKTQLWNEFKSGIKESVTFEILAPKETKSFEIIKILLLKIWNFLDGLSNSESKKIIGKFGWDLARIAPEVAEKLNSLEIKKIPELQGQAGEMRLLDTFTEFLKKFQEVVQEVKKQNGQKFQSPLVIFFDDLQWADEFIFKFLNYISRNLGNCQILFVGAFRKSEMETSILKESFNKILEEEFVELVELEPFSFELVNKIMDSMLDSKGLFNPNLVRKITEQAGGNPLFVCELLHSFLERKLFFKENGNWKIKEEQFENLEMPSTVSSVILERLEKIPKPILEILKVGAVVGRVFDSQILEGFGFEKVQDKLEEAIRLDLVEQIGNSFIFKHDSYREVLETQILKKDKVEFHKKIGELLEVKFAGNLESVVEDLARHFYEAGETEKAIDYCEKAGDSAVRKANVESGIKFYQKTNELLKITGDFKRRFDVLMKIEQFLNKFHSRKTELKNVLVEGNLIAKKHKNRQHKAIILMRFGGYYFFHKRNPEIAKKFREKSLEVFEELNYLIGILSVKGNLGLQERNQGNLSEGQRILEEVFEIFKEKKIDDPKMLAKIYDNLGVTYLWQGKRELAEEYFSKFLEVETKLDDKLGIIDATCYKGVAVHAKGEFERAEKLLKKSLKMARELNYSRGIYRACTNLGNNYREKNEIAKVDSCLLEASKAAEKTGDLSFIAGAKTSLGVNFINNFNFRSAVEPLSESSKIYNQIGKKNDEVHSLANKAIAFTFLKKFDKAESIFAEIFSLENENFEIKAANKSSIFSYQTIFFEAQKKFIKAENACENWIKIDRKIGDKKSLSGALVSKAQILILQKKYSEAIPPLEEGLEIAIRNSYQIEIHLGKLAKEKINFHLKSKKQAIGNLEKMLLQTETEEEKADIQFEIWSLNRNLRSRKEALELYLKLYKEIPNPKFKERTEELETFETYKLLKRIEELEMKDKIFLPNDFAKIIANLLNPETSFTELLDFFQTQLNASSCQIILKDSESGEFYTKAISSNFDKEIKNYSSGVLKRSLTEGKFVIPNACELANFGGSSSVSGFTFLSVIAIPIKSGKEIIGAVYLDRRKVSMKKFTDSELEQANEIAQFLTPLVLRQKKLEEDSEKLELLESGIVTGTSQMSKFLFEEAKIFAKNNEPVLIYGKTGTGKKTLAKTIHSLQNKPINKFGIFDCKYPFPEKMRALLIEKINEFNGGTLVFDKIIKLPKDVQEFLVYQMREKYLVDSKGNFGEEFNLKFIFTTNNVLEPGQIIDDLYSQIHFAKIEIPLLMERKGDIPLIADSILQQEIQKLGLRKSVIDFTSSAKALLRNISWEVGNITDLEKAISNALKRCKGKKITEKDLMPNSEERINFSETLEDKLKVVFPELKGTTFKELENAILNGFLNKFGGNKSQAAKKLGMDRGTFVRRIAKDDKTK